MRALIAFDKFKDSLTAPQACAQAAIALRSARPGWALDLCPLADGGEGFVEILTTAAAGTLHSATVAGPRDAEIRADFGLVPWGKIPARARAQLALCGLTDDAPVAVVELAQASGLARLAPGQRDPWHTTTLGTGQLIRMAVEQHGARAVVIGLGGSATHDLGLGALTALGLEPCTADGASLSSPVPAAWPALVRLAGRVFPGLPPFRIACDVDNPLLGPRGAAASYGAQKGLRAADLRHLDHESARIALMLAAHCGRPDSLMDIPGAGAAGGTAFGLLCAADARLVPGSALAAAWLDLDARIDAADLVLTGEGCFDAGSLAGKGPGDVIARARSRGKPVHVFAGAATATHQQLHVITPPGTSLPDALRQTGENLARAVRAAFQG